MPRYFAELAYNGTRFHGWQIQDNAPSVQEDLNKALAILARSQVETTGCGRTDTGVHASGFYAHFDVNEAITSTSDFAHRLNAILPDGISIYAIHPVADEAHARFDATLRSYSYYISAHKQPFLKDFTWQREFRVNIDRMNEAATFFLTHADFAAFCKAGGQQKTTLCTVTEAIWKQQGSLLVYSVSANRFLRGMVRTMVGTLLDVGLDKTSMEQFKEILESGDRTLSGQSVPPQGLFLEEIRYPYLPSQRRRPFQP